MTAIAWDGTTLAADGRITCNGYITNDQCRKIYRLQNLYVGGDVLQCMGLCGKQRDFERFFQYIQTPEFWEQDNICDVQGIIVGRDYVYHIESKTSYLLKFPRDTYLADGTGAYFALSAMHFGQDARDAVGHAMKFDPSSGGKISSCMP